jgi:hypothetical protein
MDTIENTEKTTGSFKPSTKFIEFVGGKGYINFISNQATIEGKCLSGLGMDGITFKLTIYEDGTVDFDEVDTTKTTQEERERYYKYFTENEELIIKVFGEGLSKSKVFVPVALRNGVDNFLTYEYKQWLDKQ